MWCRILSICLVSASICEAVLVQLDDTIDEHQQNVMNRSRMGSKALRDLLYDIPKTDLHMHIEGSLEASYAWDLVQKYEPSKSVAIPVTRDGGATVKNPIVTQFASTGSLENPGMEDVYQFNDLVSFLFVYAKLGTYLKEAEDFSQLAFQFCMNACKSGVKHAEIFFDPQSHTRRGLQFRTVVDGLFAGILQGEQACAAELVKQGKKGKAGTLTVNMIASILRDEAPGVYTDLAGTNDEMVDHIFVWDDTQKTGEFPTAWATVKQAVAYNEIGGPGGKRIIGIGMDNAEIDASPGATAFAGVPSRQYDSFFFNFPRWDAAKDKPRAQREVYGFPPYLFRSQYAYAQANGLKSTAHAGEEGPPEYIMSALNLGVNRIDHGVRIMEDGALVDFTVDHQVPITVCPTSNYKLHVFPIPRETGILEMLESNLLVSANSDDPAYFGGYAGEQFQFLAEACSSSVGGCGRNNPTVITVEHFKALAKNGFKSTWMTPEDKAEYLAEVDAWFTANAGTLATELAE